MRSARAAANIRDELPDLSSSLFEFTNNINAVIDTTQAHGVRLIIMTQPSMWRLDLSPDEEALLAAGRGPRSEYYYSTKALIEGIALYNNRLLEICTERQVECLDLAQKLPKDTTVFYDDVHFNETGSAQVAKIVAEYILALEPFAAIDLGDKDE